MHEECGVFGVYARDYIAVRKTVYQYGYNLRIYRGLENRILRNKPVPQLFRVYKIAVMGNSHSTALTRKPR